LYDGGVWAFENEESLITPLEKPGLLPERWDYYLGQDIFVAPIVRESRGGSVSFPFFFFFKKNIYLTTFLPLFREILKEQLNSQNLIGLIGGIVH